MNDIKNSATKHKRSSILKEGVPLEKYKTKEYNSDKNSNINRNSLSLTKSKTTKMLSWNSKLIDIISVESYKKYNYSDNARNRQLEIDRMRDKIKCKCTIF